MPNRTRRVAPVALSELLEPRRLFAATLAAPLPETFANTGATTTVYLTRYLNDPTVPVVANFTTSLGAVRLNMLEDAKPLTVENFLAYVSADRYVNSFVHRSDTLVVDDPITTSAEILQAGGYALPGFTHIPTFPPVVNEYEANGVLQNARGTVAMAKTDDPDSATSEFFFNVKDTSAVLNDPDNSGGFTVFANVNPADLGVVDAVAALTQRGFAVPFTHLPLRNYTDTDAANDVFPTEANLVMVTAASATPDVTYSVTSSNPAVVAASLDGVNLVLAHGPTIGSAQITVTATGGGQTVTSTFTANSGQLEVTLGGDDGNKSLTYADADGTLTTVSVKGGGTAAVRLTGGEIEQTVSKGKVAVTGTGLVATQVRLVGSTAKTSLSVSSKGGDKVTTLAGLTADGAVKAISAKGVHLTGPLAVAGALGSLALGSTTGATITLGGTSADRGVAVAVAGDLTDTDLTTTGVLRSLKARSFVDANAGRDDTISALAIGSVTAAGDMTSNVETLPDGNVASIKVGRTMTGNVTVHQVGTISVKGDLIGSTITPNHFADEAGGSAESRANDGIRSLKVGGAMTSVIVNSSSSINALSAGSIVGGRIVAGAPGLTVIPMENDHLGEDAIIRSMKVKGVVNDVLVSARDLGKVSIGTLQTTVDGAPWAFAADRIASLTGTTDAGTRFAVKRVDTQAEADAALAGVTLGDARVVVL